MLAVNPVRPNRIEPGVSTGRPRWFLSWCVHRSVFLPCPLHCVTNVLACNCTSELRPQCLRRQPGCLHRVWILKTLDQRLRSLSVRILSDRRPPPVRQAPSPCGAAGRRMDRRQPRRGCLAPRAFRPQGESAIPGAPESRCGLRSSHAVVCWQPARPVGQTRRCSHCANRA
jgi:hypothetical protein